MITNIDNIPQNAVSTFITGKKAIIENKVNNSPTVFASL
jgi:hypothetical protein